MLNFRDNFFFAKFATLFFILTIFGYWGIDLNSEELYIAFSFFLLVIAGFIVSRGAILLLFVRSVNAKYFRLLSDLLMMTYSLNKRLSLLSALISTATSLNLIFTKYVAFLFNFLSLDFWKLNSVLSAQSALLSAFLPIANTLYASNILRLRKFQTFGDIGGKIFSIKL